MRSNKLTTKEFIERAECVHGGKYDYSLVEYVNTNSKVKIVCPLHGIFEQSPKHHTITKRGCNICGGSKKLTEKEVVERFRKKHGNQYDYSNVNYVNDGTKVEIVCSAHGAFYQTPNDHYRGRGCKKCGIAIRANNKRLTTKIFKDRATKIHKGRYSYELVSYVNSATKVKIACLLHGIFHQSPQDHLRGCGCPKCNTSRGEKRIEQYLIKMGIVFTTQKKFEDCKCKLPLRFDFELLIGDQNVLIEYQGRQHYEPWSSKEIAKKEFNQLIIRDSIKKNYCKSNKIPLLLIPYWELDNVEKIVDEFIKVV